MHQPSALRVAIDLMHVPTRVRAIRRAPLPADVVVLLRIAAGDEAAVVAAARETGRSGDVVRTASTFFIEQVLLHPEADSYRVLGAAPEASNEELRRNMALLLRWLHPDVDRNGERSIFATRVTKAWNELKTPARRAHHDGAALVESNARAERNSRSRSRSRGKVSGKVLVRTRAIKKPGFLKRALWSLLRPAKH